MPIQLLRPFLFFVIVLQVASSCSTVKQSSQTTVADISRIHFLGKYDIPYNLTFNNTTVGGLSGIDYDKKNDLYYLVCDDRSDKNPARFYTARIFFTEKGIDSLVFKSVKNMLQPGGNIYPNNKQDKFHTPDPEAMRFNPISKELVWSSEGERIIKEKDTVLIDPAVITISSNGEYKNSFILPANVVMNVTEKGPRQNSVFEGMSFADHFKTLYVSIEEPLYEDGPRAAVTENAAFIRILKFDVTGKQNIAQYAYRLSPVAYPASPEDGFKINGVPDILSIGNNKLLVIERSFSTGRLACTIRVFIADLHNATDISNISLKGNNSFIPASKKLLINMDDLGIYTDNIEGMTFGPLLPNGHKTLLFIADNNFNILEKAQVLLFEVIE